MCVCVCRAFIYVLLRTCIQNHLYIIWTICHKSASRLLTFHILRRVLVITAWLQRIDNRKRDVLYNTLSRPGGDNDRLITHLDYCVITWQHILPIFEYRLICILESNMLSIDSAIYRLFTAQKAIQNSNRLSLYWRNLVLCAKISWARLQYKRVTNYWVALTRHSLLWRWLYKWPNAACRHLKIVADFVIGALACAEYWNCPKNSP